MVEVTEINIEIMRILGASGESMTPSQIIKRLPKYNKKDIKYSIRRLREKGLIRVIPNLLDMRRVFYRLSTAEEIDVNTNRIKDIEMKVFRELGQNFSSTATLEDMEAAVHSS